MVFRFSMILALIASPALAYDPAPGDGMYAGFADNGPGGQFGTQISINLQRTGALVELKAGADTGLSCTYFADLDSGFVKAIEGQCFEITTVSLSQTGEGTALTAPELWPDPLPLMARSAVLEDLDRTVPPNGFDALGLTVGMTRAEIEAALAERDWTVFDAFYRERTPEWGHWEVTYAPAGSEGRARDLAESFRIEYSGGTGTVASDGMDRPAISVRRDVNYTRVDNPPELIVLDQALRDKYGIDGGVDLDGIGKTQDRFFDASGGFVLDRLERGIPPCRDYERPAQFDKAENVEPCVFQLTVSKSARANRVLGMSVILTDRFAERQQTVIQQLARTHEMLSRISGALQGGATGGGAAPEL